MKTRKTISLVLFICFITILYFNLTAFEFGIVGLTKKSGFDFGCICHNFRPEPEVSVILSGPPIVNVNDTVDYVLRISGLPGIAAGCDIAARLGTLYTSPLDTNLKREENFPGEGFEITHRYPKLFTSDTLEFIFTYIAPAFPVLDTIFANGNSVNLNSEPSGDRWNFADNFQVEIRDIPLPVELTSFTSAVVTNSVHLKWTTSIEENNSGFEIERSNVIGQLTTGWMKLGFVNGNGTTSTPKDYSFVDEIISTGKYNYRLKQIDYNGNFVYYNLANEVEVEVPLTFNLSQNYPNPFNPVTKINYNLPVGGNVILSVYDAAGKETRRLIDGHLEMGYYSVLFDASQLSSGVYYYRLSLAGEKNFTSTKKMLLIK